MNDDHTLDPPPPYEATPGSGQAQRPIPVSNDSARSGQAGGKAAQAPSTNPQPVTTQSGGAGPSSHPPPGPPPHGHASGTIGIARQFPPAFGLYSDGFSRTFMIGEHQDQPLYAVRLHTGFSGQPPVVLHNGPNADRCATLAAVDFGTYSSGMTVTLPPPMHRVAAGAGAAASTVEVEFGMGWHRSYLFRIEVGVGPEAERVETFEWRHSYGAAVEALGGDFDGWKLVRCERRPPSGTPQDQVFRPTGGYTTSDGLEVVAAWSDSRMSLTKQAKFAFVGTGDTGLLGERWAVMAVMSAMGIWERERRRKRRRRT